MTKTILSRTFKLTVVIIIAIVLQIVAMIFVYVGILGDSRFGMISLVLLGASTGLYLFLVYTLWRVITVIYEK